MSTYFKAETDVVQNLIDYFFSKFDCHKSFHRMDVKWKNMGLPAYFLKRTEALYAELNEKVEAVISSYSAAVDFLQYIYLVLVAKNR